MGLGVDGRDAEHAAHPVGADADGGDGRRGLHPAVPPALDVRGVQEQVGNPTSPRSREASSATPASSNLHIALIWSFESLSMPIFWAIRSIFLVETPLAHDFAAAAAPARSARDYLSIRPSGKCVSARSLGMRSTMSPTGVASPRSR